MKQTLGQTNRSEATIVPFSNVKFETVQFETEYVVMRQLSCSYHHERNDWTWFKIVCFEICQSFFKHGFTVSFGYYYVTHSECVQLESHYPRPSRSLVTSIPDKVARGQRFRPCYFSITFNFVLVPFLLKISVSNGLRRAF